jgi:hypothetical protein
MKVTIYGASDDLIEFEGDISDEHDCSGNAKKYYVYHEDELQFVFQIKYEGCWNILVQLDTKTFDEDKANKCKDWDIKLDMVGSNEYSRYSMVLHIDSGEDKFEIAKRRRK